MNIEIVRDLLIQRSRRDDQAVGIIEATEENYGEALILRGCAPAIIISLLDRAIGKMPLKRRIQLRYN